MDARYIKIDESYIGEKETPRKCEIVIEDPDTSDGGNPEMCSITIQSLNTGHRYSRLYLSDETVGLLINVLQVWQRHER